jgi:putative oxidoreductase
MKDFFSIKYSDKLLHVWLLIYRVVVSAFMLTHGLPKLYRFFGDQEIRFADPLGIGVIPSLVLVVFAEFFCSILLIVGYKTRLAPLIITMIVIAFIHHAGDPFNRIELGLMFLVAYIGSADFLTSQLIILRPQA